VLVELGLVEQRYKAVLEVLDGATVTDVPRRNGVVRQTVYDWLRRYAAGGLAGWPTRHPSRSPAPIRWLGGRGRHPRAAPGPSRLGPPHHRPSAAARRRRPRAGPLVDLSLPGPRTASSTPGPAQAPQRQQALGAFPGH
jgi:hypothetical protein